MLANEIFERHLLGNLLQQKQYFSKVFGILKVDYFTENRKSLFKLLKEHYLEHKTAPTFADVAIKIKNLPDDTFRNSVIQELKEVKTEATAGNVDALAQETLKFVKDALYLQALEIGSKGLVEKNENLKQKAEQILDERAKVNIQSDVGIEFMDADIIDYYGLALDGLLTQHQSLNDRLGPGFLPGTLSVILAPSGVGKSLMMTDLVTGFIKQKKNVLLVSLEMSQQEVMKRVHANALNINIENFLPKNFNKDYFLMKLNEQKDLGTFYVKDYPAQSFSALQLESLLETFKNEKDITFDVVFVDYLGIMKSDLISPSAGLYSYVKSIAEEVRAVAMRTGTIIVSANQLNRGSTNSTDADNSYVSDSYGTVMTADFMLFLLQTEEMKAQGDIICKITKNRFSGKTEVFPMKVDYQKMRFLDPEDVVSIDSRDDFAKSFEENKAQTNQQFIEHNIQDAKNAQNWNAQHAKGANVEVKQSLDDILNSL